MLRRGAAREVTEYVRGAARLLLLRYADDICCYAHTRVTLMLRCCYDVAATPAADVYATSTLPMVMMLLPLFTLLLLLRRCYCTLPLYDAIAAGHDDFLRDDAVAAMLLSIFRYATFITTLRLRFMLLR